MKKLKFLPLCICFILCLTACDGKNTSSNITSPSVLSEHNPVSSTAERESIQSNGETFDITPDELIRLIADSRDVQPDPYFYYPENQREEVQADGTIRRFYTFGNGGEIEIIYDEGSKLVKEITFALEHKPWKPREMDSMWYCITVLTHAIDSNSAEEIMAQAGNYTLNPSKQIETVFEGKNVTYPFSVQESDLVVFSILPK